MAESPINDIQDLWGIYQATKAQLQAVQALKTSLLAVFDDIATLAPGAPNDDYLAYNRSGEGGGESWTRQSLLDRLESLQNQEAELTKTMREQRLLAIQATPGYATKRIRQPRVDLLSY
jgi:hypothetical protein